MTFGSLHSQSQVQISSYSAKANNTTSNWQELTFFYSLRETFTKLESNNPVLLITFKNEYNFSGLKELGYPSPTS